jgi:two-component system heavy metal sensor histidine kinase CusS
MTARTGAWLLRRSMTARIGISFALVALLLVATCGMLLDRLVANELRDQSELELLSTLVFLREDLATLSGGPPAAQALLDRVERRERLHVRLTDAGDRTLLQSHAFVGPGVPGDSEIFDAGTLPADANLADLRAVRAGSRAASSEWDGPNGRRYRVLRGTVRGASPASGLPEVVGVMVTREAAKTREVRRGELLRLVAALGAALVVAGCLGVVIARAVLADARRLGAAAGRIGAHALHERLALEDVPVELEASARAFNRMLDRLQASFDRLSRFSAEVAHDLRTPIGNLLGEAQVALSRERDAAEYRGVLESAVEEYERMSRMIGNMLFLARSDNDQTVLDRESIPLDRLVPRVAAYFELLAEERRVTLRAVVERLADVPAILVADESLVTRAIGNLLSNALRHANPGTEVLMRATVAADGACAIEVANSGPRIPADLVERVFERFFRVAAAREDSATGSGLGLAIVRSIMELHRGSVDVASDDERTVFTLRFPV